MAEGLDSIMTLLLVITFATNCKSSRGPQLEDSNFKAMSILDGSATITETRKGSLITVNRYTRRGSISATQKLCNGTHVVIDIARIT